MKNWIKENWFKFFLLVVIGIYLLIFIYNQYRLTKNDNAEKLQWCMVHIDDFSGDTTEKKLDLCISKYYGKYHLPFPSMYTNK